MKWLQILALAAPLLVACNSNALDSAASSPEPVESPSSVSPSPSPTTSPATPEPVHMVDVIGLSEKDAESEIESLGLNVQVIVSSTYTLDRDPGEVFQQTPEPKRALSDGGIVYLTVARSTIWTEDQVALAAKAIADGIKHSHPLDLRLGAAHCAISKLDDEYKTYDEFQHSVLGEERFTGTQEDLFRDLTILGNCEDSVGI